jgi:malonate transporter
MALEIGTALLPVFFVLALGYTAGKLRLIDNRNVSSLDTLVMKIALPVSLFTSLASSSRAQIAARWPLAVISAVVMGVAYAGTEVLQRRVYRLTPAESAVQALTVAFPNCAAVGLPLLGSVLGPSAVLGVAVVLAVGSVTLSPVTLLVLEREQHRSRSIWPPIAASLRKPVVIGPVLGLAWSLLGIPLPHLAQVSLTEIGSVTAGLALFLTGLVLSAQTIEISGNALASTLLTVVVRPALAFLAIRIAGVSGELAQETLLLLAIPAGFFGVLLGLDYGVKPPAVGMTLLLSTVLSVVTLSVLIAFLPRL